MDLCKNFDFYHFSIASYMDGSIKGCLMYSVEGRGNMLVGGEEKEEDGHRPQSWDLWVCYAGRKDCLLHGEEWHFTKLFWFSVWKGVHQQYCWTILDGSSGLHGKWIWESMEKNSWENWVLKLNLEYRIKLFATLVLGGRLRICGWKLKEISPTPHVILRRYL